MAVQFSLAQTHMKSPIFERLPQLRYGGPKDPLYLTQDQHFDLLEDVGFVGRAYFGPKANPMRGCVGMYRGRPVIVDESAPRLAWGEESDERDRLNTVGAVLVIGIGALLLWQLFSFFGWM